MKYTLQQRVFIYATFVKTESPSDTKKIFQQEFPDVSPPHSQTIKSIVQRFRETGTFDDYVSEQKRMLTEETLDEIFSRVSNSPNTPLHLIAEEMGLKVSTLNAALRILQTRYKVKILPKSKSTKNTKQDKTWKSKATKRNQVIPVPLLSNLRLRMIDNELGNSDNSTEEYILSDDPLKVPDSHLGRFEEVIVPTIKTEVKEEIVISDSEDEVIECTDYSNAIVLDENSLDDGTSS